MAISDSTSAVAAADTTTLAAEGDGPDNADKPPNSSSSSGMAYLTKRFHGALDLDAANRKLANPGLVNGSAASSPMAPENSKYNNTHNNHGNSTFPLPPPDSHLRGVKEPGLTRNALATKLSTHPDSTHANNNNSDRKSVKSSKSVRSFKGDPDDDGLSPMHSPVLVSPTESYWAGDSAPPSRPASKPASRAPSMSAGVAGNKILGSLPPPQSQQQNQQQQNQQTPGRERRGSKPDVPSTPGRTSRAGSIHSEKGESSSSHKFNLKDLLSSGPKLSRKSSQRSTSSRRSDSDYGGGTGTGGEGGGGGRARSTAGDSAASLSQKYGVCQKVAIGKGATSVVRLAHKWDRSEEKLYAVKEFRKRRKNESEKEYVKKLTAEFCISSTLHHPNVVETVDLVQDENMNWCEVMEFCPGGDLYAAIKRGGMSPAEVECCFKQMLKGVAYLHGQGVAHRDLKPENLFFDTKGHLKIGDYGASTVYRLPWEKTVHMSSGLCGSEPYIAPEQFLNKPYDARLVDIWACGIVYYCLHFQELPWRAAQPATDQLYSAYAQACASTNASISACPPTINNLSPRQCRPLIRKMLEPNPGERWAIEKVVGHVWVESVEVCHDVESPRHVHGCARELGAAYMNGN